MIRFTQRIRAERPARECLWFAADFRNLPLWDPGVASARKITEGALGSGARFEVRLTPAMNSLRLHYEMLRFSPPFAATLRGEGHGLTIVDEIRVEPIGEDGAWLDWTVELHIAGPLRGRILPPLVRLGVQRAARGLSRALRAPAAARLGAGGRIADRLLLPGAARFTRQGMRVARLPPLVERAESRHIAITGVTSGLGEAAAIALARRGATLTVIGRDAERLQALQRRLRVDSGSRATIIDADLGNMQAVADAAAALRAGPPVDVLINNAGALFAERADTVDGFERALAVNLLAPMLLGDGLAPAMPSGARIINVVSGGMYLTPLVLDDLQYTRGRYDGAVAYGRAKRALALLTQRRARAWPHLALHSVHPGWADTPGVASSLPGFRRVMRPFLRSAQQGADSIIWLAVADAGTHSRNGVWFDRAPHTLDVLSRTRCSPSDIDTLDGQISTLIGKWLSPIPDLD